MVKTDKNSCFTGMEIAVIGMDGRFPGARNIREYWHNLKNGIESIGFFSDEELEQAGIDSGLLKNSNYVKAQARLDDIENFDAAFFGYTPKEAEVMDPQVRIFHECAWKALEDAGYVPDNCNKIIGCYAGASSNLYWEALTFLSGNWDGIGQFEARLLYDKDFLSTRIAHKLGLEGPAITLQTACSTSLVAIHLAYQGLLSGECDLALAGGVTVVNMRKEGYRHSEGMILSPDGHCKTFDAEARGTIFGDGVGVVVLKRLEEAISDRDNIYAVIRSSFINNDGKSKANYSAPSIEGQARVIKTALKLAEVEPESIGYLEAHGTGTTLGDPVEFEGLRMAFNSKKRHFCALGSVKTNVGHLNMAAGVAGFIKAVLALKNRQIPAGLHFRQANPEIDLENSPFYVNTKLIPWPGTHYPLRAGVSSFGIGGTNAHVVLEEAPGGSAGKSKPLSSSERIWQLILLSAGSEAALERNTRNLVEYLQEEQDIDLVDAAYTLQVGRAALSHRKMLVCKDINEAIAELSSPDSRRVHTAACKKEAKELVFMFAGLGSQYVGMGTNLYREEPFFREEMDRCFAILRPLLNYDLKAILFPRLPVQSAASSETITRPDIAQVAIFILEYTLARLLLHWGITPYALIGYSFGEYAAACISGVFSLQDALKLVVFRGELLQKMPPGLMMSVPLTKEELVPLLRDDLSIAVDNGHSCLVSGGIESIDAFEEEMKKRRCLCMRIQASRALHSSMMAPILEEYEERVARCDLREPRIPYISNVTGTWIKPGEATNPGYWSNHLRQTVQFAKGIKELLKRENSIFLEIGPGRDLTILLTRYLEGKPDQGVLDLVRHPKKEESDVSFLLGRIGRLWLRGGGVDWQRFHLPAQKHLVSLPTYSFEPQRFPIRGNLFDKGAGLLSGIDLSWRKPDKSDWFYVPSWKRAPLPAQEPEDEPESSRWLVFCDEWGLGEGLLEKLSKETPTQGVVVIRRGTRFARLKAGEYTVNPGSHGDYEALFSEPWAVERFPSKVIHLWCIGEEREWSDYVLDFGYYSLLHLAQAIGRHHVRETTRITVITNGMQEVIGGDLLYPEKAVVLGPVKVIPAEYPQIGCRCVDIVLPQKGSAQVGSLQDQLILEIDSTHRDSLVAYRGRHRWVNHFEPRRLAESHKQTLLPKERGIYLVTGGLGGIGLALAEYLARNFQARLVLTGRSHFPDRAGWQQWLSNHSDNDSVSKRIKKLQELEAWGSEILVCCADASNESSMQAIVEQTLQRFGRINGVIHCAGLADGEIIQRRALEKPDPILAAKVQGTLVLDRILKMARLDFMILCSSTASILGGIGQVGYCAANSFLDAFANYKFYNDELLTLAINWERWQHVGIATIAEEVHRKFTGEDMVGGISREEGIETFKIILGSRLPQVIVSSRDFSSLVERANTLSASSLMESLEERSVSESMVYQRPKLETEYVPPRDKTEKILAEIWSKFFGFEQVGIHDDFFDLGGDSLKAIIIASRIHKELNHDVPIAEFFNQPTIAGLARYINGSARTDTFMSIEPVEEKEYYTLSSAQKRLYILQQIEVDNKSYNQPNVVILEGELEKGRLEDTFQRLIARHESLRTSFEMRGEEPIQRIHKQVDFAIECYEVESNQRKVNIDVPIKEFLRPFDLSSAPLFRVGLVRLETRKQILMVDMHHIIADGISIWIMKKEFMTLYNRESLPTLRLQYRDFSLWQGQKLRDGTSKEQEKYWLAQFAGEIPVLNLPCDYERPAIHRFAGDYMNFEIETEQAAALRRLALGNESTLYMVLISFYTILLSKLSGQEDIVVGSPSAGRRHPDIQQAIGMFANTLALRNFPRPEKRFTDFLGEVRECTLLSLQNQDYQFEDLVERVSVKRDAGRNPLFDVMFVLQNMERKELEIPGLKLTPYPYEYQMVKFDLTLTAVEAGEKINFIFEYSTSLFRKETIARFIRYFKRVASLVIGNPRRKIAEIGLLSENERLQILYDFNDTQAEYPADKSIGRLFVDWVERVPDRTAVTGHSLEWKNEVVHVTYICLLQRAASLARLLRRQGVRPDIIVGIMAYRSLEMLTGIFGIVEAGGAYLPIDPNYPRERIEYMLRDSGARALIVGAQDPVPQHPTGHELEIIPITGIQDRDERRSPKTGSGGCLAYVIYTSGTTGNPKGVLIEHHSLVNRLNWMQERYPLDERTTILHKTPFTFDVSVWEIFWWAVVGARVCLLVPGGEKDPGTIIDTIEKYHVAVMHFVPSMLAGFLDYIRETEAPKRLASLKQVIASGEALTLAHVKQFSELLHRENATRLANLYGPTEATIDVSFFDCFDQDRWDIIPIGRPIDNTKLLIVDRTLGLQPVGVVGEICISGVGLARGYLNRPELTAETFVAVPALCLQAQPGVEAQNFVPLQSPNTRHLYKTGDLARWLPDGNIEFLGRIDHQVKIRGFRIELKEIENRLLRHPQIKEAVVLAAHKGNRVGEGPMALYAYFVSCRKFTKTELKEYLLETLPEYMIPAYFIQVEEIPLSPNGKIDRKALKARGTGLGTDTEYVAPRNDLEKKIAEIWQDVLKVDRVGIHENFFDLGGTSLDIIKLHMKFKEIFNEEDTVLQMFRYTTIGSYADYLNRKREKKQDTGGDRERTVSIENIKKSRTNQRRKRRGLLDA